MAILLILISALFGFSSVLQLEPIDEGALYPWFIKQGRTRSFACGVFCLMFGIAGLYVYYH